ncbi:MAG: tyrosine-type recombinase/integrase [Sneathiella sp.]|uniref:tyrosine-type recombinase/integrase n=1 Tax=Sneathiella sp. TaxID=1964365 RepID=UPI0030020B15
MPKLIKRFVDSAPLPQPGEKDIMLWDEEIKGFGIRIKPTGVKSYLVQYRNDGRSRRLTLGKHGTITAEEARQLAKEHLGDVAKGNDPAEEKLQKRKAPTFAQLAEDYMERHAKPNKRPASIKTDQATIDKILLPKLANRKVREIRQRDIEQVILRLQKTPYRANRVRALLSKLFSLAESWGWCDKNPVRGVQKFPEHKRDRWLSEDELKRLALVLEHHPNKRAVTIVRLLILTGARRGELMKAKWEDFDLQRGVWSKPAHTTKQKRTEHVPLSEDALIILKDWLNDAPSKMSYIFPGDTSDQPITDIKHFWEGVREAADLADVRIHDLRHTFASHLVSSGVSLPIVGRLLGHTQPQTTQRYAHLADDPLREAANIMKIKLE